MTQLLEMSSYYPNRMLNYGRVVLVSSHPLFLVGLRNELNSWGGFKVVGEATSAADVIKHVSTHNVNLIIVDQTRPGEALNLIKTLQAQLLRRVPIVVLGSSESESQIAQLRQIGVSHFASKVLPVNQLREVLEEAVQEPRALPIAAWSPIPIRIKKVDNCPLSPRETQILEVIAEGHSNKEVAQLLCISNHTLKNHLNNIFKKLDVEDRTQALLLGVRNGWVVL